MSTNTNTNTSNTATPTCDNAIYKEAATEAFVEGLVDCYCEARATLDIRLDTARKIADDSSEEFIDFLYNLMKRVSAEEFEKFIESNELSSADRVTCIALFAKAHLPEDYGNDKEEEDSSKSCYNCWRECLDKGYCPYEVDDGTGEIGEPFDGQAELDALIKANSEAGVADINPDMAALSKLMAKIIGGRHSK